MLVLILKAEFIKPFNLSSANNKDQIIFPIANSFDKKNRINCKTWFAFYAMKNAILSNPYVIEMCLVE